MKMKIRDLESLLAQQQDASVGTINSKIGSERAELMKRYFAEPYGDEVDGLSSVVDTSVRDVIESIKPELMDIFVGADKVVEFAPMGAEDVEAARQETAVCQHVFMQMNSGFQVLYSWFTDALMLKNGYIKRFWDDRKRVEIEEYDDLTPDDAVALIARLSETSDKVEVLERSGGIDEETGAVELMYVKLKLTTTERRYVVENVPPEEMFVSAQWDRLDFDGVPFIAHKPRITASDLIEMGFDKKQVEQLKTVDVELDSEEAYTRHSVDDHDQYGGRSNRDDVMREVEVWECYIRADFDGDGVAEQLQVFTEGENGKILKRNGKLAITEVTSPPFEVLCPLPIPHRHHGMSIAEIVADLAKIKTVLTRQLLDNIVGSNNPDEVVDSDALTDQATEDLEVTGLGRTIRIPGGMASYGVVQPVNTSAQSLAGIEYVDALREGRTGVTRFNQGLDPDSLNQTATGIKQLMTAGQKKILMIARIFAETGVKGLFNNMHRDLRAGPIKELAVQLQGEYVTVNPRMWVNRTEMVVNVGLGTGDRDLQFSRLMMILGEQKEMLAQGLDVYDKLYTTYVRLLELSGFKDASSFIPSPDEVKAMAAKSPEPAPDPTQIAIQFQAQIEAQKLEIEKMKLQQKQLEVMLKDDRERDLAAAKIEADEAARYEERIDARRVVNG